MKNFNILNTLKISLHKYNANKIYAKHNKRKLEEQDVAKVWILLLFLA